MRRALLGMLVALVAFPAHFALAQSGSCPSPAALYALRLLDEHALLKAIGARPALAVSVEERDEQRIEHRFWDVKVRNIWGADGTRCHTALIDAFLHESYRNERDEFERRILRAKVATLVADERSLQARQVRPGDAIREVPYRDPLREADARFIPRSVDGASLYLVAAERAGSGARRYSASGRDPVPYCSIPRTQTLIWKRGDEEISIPIAGAVWSEADRARLDAQLKGIVVPADGKVSCPKDAVAWEYWEAKGQPVVTATRDGADIDLVVTARKCHGLMNRDIDPLSSYCDAAQELRALHHEVRGTKLTTHMRAEIAATELSAPCVDCWLTVAPFAFPDGDPSPHAIDAQIGRKEGGDERQVTRGLEPVSVWPGVYLAEVRRGSKATTYQLTILPGAPKIVLNE